jgi:phosphoribosylanthranilate isomerase
MVGVVFFEKSPRNIDHVTAAALAARARGRAKIVALTVDADDDALKDIVAAVQPDMFQLHGSETPERVAAIRAKFGVAVMKVIGIASQADLAQLPAYAEVADMLLLDAKPPSDALRPGGNGVPFDWNLLAGLDLAKPFMLSGGLDADNVSEALRRTHAPGVDVSSGVESAPGVKDPARIVAFIQAARAASPDPELKPAGSPASPSSANQTSIAS